MIKISWYVTYEACRLYALMLDDIEMEAMMTGGTFYDLVVQQKLRCEEHIDNILRYGSVTQKLSIDDLPPPYISLNCKNEADVKSANRAFQKAIIDGISLPTNEVLGIDLPQQLSD